MVQIGEDTKTSASELHMCAPLQTHTHRRFHTYAAYVNTYTHVPPHPPGRCALTV